MNEKTTKEVKTLPIITKFIMTIGELPTSYLMSMTYLEQVTWLCNYLEKTVIPALNQNGEAVKELQELYELLRTYVNEYFDNLDIQTEVNNKLDDMAESGQLADIIAQYLEVASVLGFNTKNSLKSADNLVNGSITKTLGENTYNDGKGTYYKIRTITSSDIIDNDNILALSNYPTLIAEKLPDYRMNQVENNINTLSNEIDLLTNKRYIFIGDSYGTGQNELSEQTTPWTTLVPQYLGLTENDYYKDSSNGSGFLHGYLFLNQLKRVEQNVDDKNTITDIVVIGGYNDASHEINDIVNAIGEFCEYAHEKFPNALISIGCVGWSKVYTARQHIANRSICAYTQCGKFGARYLNNVEYILHDYSLFSGDNYHPNQNGQNELSLYLTDAIINGSCNVIRGTVKPTTEKYDDTSTINPQYILQMQNNGKITLSIYIDYFTIGTPLNLNRNKTISLLKFTDGLIMGSGVPAFNTHAMVFGATANASQLYTIPCTFATVYDSSNNCCNFSLTVDRIKESFTNVSAFSIGVINIELPALYC